MLRPDPVEAATLGPRAALRLIREVWIDQGIPPERTEHLDDRLTEVAEGGGSAAWTILARALWQDQDLRRSLDRVQGLRTRVWSAAWGGVFPAITALLAEAAGQRIEVGLAIGAIDGLVWIPDAAFRDLVYDLEIGEHGTGIAWQELADARDLDEHPQGCGHLWRAWIRWAAEGGEVQRGFVAYPHYIGSLLAWGLPLTAPRIAPLLAAIRAHPAPGPLLAVGEVPVLLPWTPRRLPTLPELVVASRAPEERRVLTAAWSRHGFRAGAAIDPRLALLGLLAHGPERHPARAVVALLHAAVRHCASAGELLASGVLRIAMVAQPSIAHLWVVRVGERLLVDADGLAGLISWIGLFPPCYQRTRERPSTWSFSTLEHCGWSALAQLRRWDLVTLSPAVAELSERTRWIAFPPGGIIASLPSLNATLAPAGLVDQHSCEMSIEYPWSPIDDA